MQGHQYYALLLGGVMMLAFLYISSALLDSRLDAGPTSEAEYGILLRPRTERVGEIITCHVL